MAAYSPTTDIRRKDLDHASFEGTVLNDEQKKEPSFSYIRSYILPYSRSRRWERVVRLLEYFCKGADVSLDHFVTYQLPGQSDQHQATAWVSDRNEINQSSSAPSNFERVLSAPELYKVLQQKVCGMAFSPNRDLEPANNTAICRALRIYINHANGLCILGLIKTAPLWQAQGFRELLSYYVLTPKPRIRVYQSSWWNGCFIMHFNIPFHAISNSDRKDTRTIRDKGELRHRFDLSFLDPSNSTDVRTGDRPGSIGPAFLHQVTCSFMLTGRSESDWTAVCLNEDSFDDQQKLNTDDELETDGLGPDGEVDPILDEPSLNGVHLPRPYGLAFLANQFVTVVEHQWDIEHQFGESLERNSPDSVGELPGQLSAKDIKQWTRQSVNRLEMVRNSISILVGELDRFLELQVIFGQDDIPRGPLFQSLVDDGLAMKSLKSLRESRTDLEGVERALEQLQVRFERIQSELGTAKRIMPRNQLLRRRPNRKVAHSREIKACASIIRLCVFWALGSGLCPSVYFQSDNHLSPHFIAVMATCTVNGLQDLLGKAGLDTPVPDFPGSDIVHNPQDIFRAYLADTLQKLVEVDKAVAYDAIQPSNMTGMGDLVIVSPRLRLKDIKPKDLVSDLAHRLPRSPPFACPIPDGIHLRVLSSPNTLSRLLLPYVHDRGSSYGYDASVGLVDADKAEGPRKKVIVEFSSPNMASEFQVSHLRSALIGAYVANIHAGMGWDVVKMNYLGDWGKQIGLLAAGWQRFGSEEEFQKAPLQHLLQVNHKIEELFKPEQEECKTAKAEGKDATEIESRGLYAERDVFFKKMEDKDPEAIALWQRFRDATVEDYKTSYARLGIQFDEYSGESQVSAESIQEIEAALKEKGVYEEHEGAWRIDFANHDAKGLSTAVVRYRNGTTSYLLRDLAAVLDRYKAHSFDKMIYVVAMEQEMHFHRVTKTLELIGRKDLAEKIQHVPFAKITGLLDQFKHAQLLSDYIDGCRSVMQAGMPEDAEDPVFVTKTDQSLESVGLSGLFIQDLNHKRTTSYACDAKIMTAFEGETGAAIQNCYARLLTTLDGKTDDIDYGSLDYSQLETEDYSEVLRIMAQFPDTTYASFKTLEPTAVIIYLGRLVDQVMVTLDDDDEQDWTDREGAMKARMALYENARQVLENGLRMLGLSPWSG
ncbi:hypothetical protein EDB81DRAFT_646578 [Dactylonectria macrodidyma]|uniref:arginine--tRNA ligase n=1 Tax=Dactylonectria macrodidyma TaxID=307937 RepID=A0A9P9FAR6_9HYPO|nr:hypothetical protein EDB81DRAFT_646578 [Dactylonectria macrodidyma]